MLVSCFRKEFHKIDFFDTRVIESVLISLNTKFSSITYSYVYKKLIITSKKIKTSKILKEVYISGYFFS